MPRVCGRHVGGDVGPLVRRDARGLGNTKANYLEGFYSVLTCLEQAIDDQLEEIGDEQ